MRIGKYSGTKSRVVSNLEHLRFFGQGSWSPFPLPNSLVTVHLCK